jgi:hypothetical protein
MVRRNLVLSFMLPVIPTFRSIPLQFQLRKLLATVVCPLLVLLVLPRVSLLVLLLLSNDLLSLVLLLGLSCLRSWLLVLGLLLLVTESILSVVRRELRVLVPVVNRLFGLVPHLLVEFLSLRRVALLLSRRSRVRFLILMMRANWVCLRVHGASWYILGRSWDGVLVKP